MYVPSHHKYIELTLIRFTPSDAFHDHGDEAKIQSRVRLASSTTARTNLAILPLPPCCIAEQPRRGCGMHTTESVAGGPLVKLSVF
jgi:hypothetical protein